MVGILLSFFALGLLGGVFSSDTGLQVFSLVTGVPTAVLAVRGFRSSTLLIGEGEVTVRTLLRRRRWALDQVSGASIDGGIIGAGAYKRRFPVIHLVNGSSYECREINTSAARASELDPIVAAINEAVQRPPGTA